MTAGPTANILEWLKALGPSFIALAVFIVTGLFYRWQVRLAKQRLRHDLYNRRFAIYTAFQELLLALVEKSDDEIKAQFRKAGIARFEVQFLIDDPQIQAYLEKLYKQICEDVINNIMYLQSVTKYDAMMHDPQIIQEVAERSLELGTAKLALADSHLAGLSKQFAKVLKLVDFWK